MRTLRRNKRRFWYANYTSSHDVLDADGMYTGEQQLVYSEPVEAHGNISGAKGDASVAQFGVNVDYDYVITLERANMQEGDILWIGVKPDAPHNYTVSRISTTPNGVAIAAKRVDVSGT